MFPSVARKVDLFQPPLSLYPRLPGELDQDVQQRLSIETTIYLSQNAKRASARKDTGLDQSLFYVQLFRLRINII